MSQVVLFDHSIWAGLKAAFVDDLACVLESNV